MDAELEALTQAYWHASDVGGRAAIKWAQNEIIRLRAELKIQDEANEILTRSQFRWIPMSERVPTDKDELETLAGGYVLTCARNGVVLTECAEMAAKYGTTHWAIIPPPPKKSLAELDREACEAAVQKVMATCNRSPEHDPEAAHYAQMLREGYMQGLRLGREEE